jgi:hypothetical protein
LLPKATLAADILGKKIAATATADEQTQIAEFVKSYDEPLSTQRETRIYQLRRGSGRGFSFVLTEMLPQATIYGSRETPVVMATATAEDHEKIKAMIEAHAEKPVRRHRAARFAIKFVGSQLGERQRAREALLAAIEKQDMRQILTLLAPDAKSKQHLLEYTLDEREKPATISMLLENGYAKAKNHISTPFIVRLVQEAERDGGWNTERLDVLRAAIASLHKQNISIMQKDLRGKTVLDFAMDTKVRQIIDDALAAEQKNPELKMSAIMQQLPQTSAEALQYLPTMQQAEQTIQLLGSKLGIQDLKLSLPISVLPKAKENQR